MLLILLYIIYNFINFERENKRIFHFKDAEIFFILIFKLIRIGLVYRFLKNI